MQLQGRNAVQHFKSLLPSQRHTYLSSILHQDHATKSSPSSVGESFEIYEPSDGFTPNLTPYFFGKNFDAFLRHDYTRRSLLTATLYLSRPLTKDEAERIVWCSLNQHHTRTGVYSKFAYNPLVYVCVHALTAVGLRTGRLSRDWAYIWRDFTVYNAFGDIFCISEYPSPNMRDLRTRWLDEKKGYSGLRGLRGMQELSDIADRDHPGRSEHKRSYRIDMVPRDVLRGPTFWEVYKGLSKDDEWRKLKYDVSTFLGPRTDEPAVEP